MQNAVNARGIEYLVHFTRLENLDSILQYGLIPRVQLEGINPHAFLFNDYLRLDNCKNANCCSITFPNYKMFYSFRMQDTTKEWCVLGIKRDILWEKPCAFCVENAASTNATSIPIINRMGVNAFNRLFDEIAGKPPRMQLELPYNCTTNPQAEVLVFNTIEPSNIFGVVFSSQIRANEYAHRYSNLNLQFVYDQNFFRPRKDFEYWR
jgi:hypothetical protein